MPYLRMLMLIVLAALLSACSWSGWFSPNYQSNRNGSSGNNYYHPYDYGTDTAHSYKRDAPRSRPFRPPAPSYHFAVTPTPQKHTTVDKDWIHSQHGTGYTIQVADDNDPSRVADVLHKAPKTGRMTQYKYKDGETTRYGGTVGSYATKEEAEQAMQRLPETMRGTATVQQWDGIQSKVNKAPPSTIPLPDIYQDSTTE